MYGKYAICWKDQNALCGDRLSADDRVWYVNDSID